MFVDKGGEEGGVGSLDFFSLLFSLSIYLCMGHVSLWLWFVWLELCDVMTLYLWVARAWIFVRLFARPYVLVWWTFGYVDLSLVIIICIWFVTWMMYWCLALILCYCCENSCHTHHIYICLYKHFLFALPRIWLYVNSCFSIYVWALGILRPIWLLINSCTYLGGVSHIHIFENLLKF